MNPSSDFKRLVVWGVELDGNNMVVMVADDGEASRGAFLCPINILCEMSRIRRRLTKETG